ncbi:MAG: ROK family transcriptional regulator [Mycobacterium sp.]
MSQGEQPVGEVRRPPRIGTSTDDVRRRNLSGVLTLVHRHRALSRAELTRRTGLSRSTTKDLVEELAAHGLVEESLAAAAAQVGRPSAIVRPSTRMLCVAINPDVDAITIGVVSMGGTVLEMTRHPTAGVPTAQDAVAIASAAIDRIRGELADDQRLIAIGVAVPGLVRASDSTVRLAPHLDWHDQEIGQLLSSATGLPVYAANDANAGAIAEHIFGNHLNADHMIYVNGGAGGIGAGFVVAGTLLEGAAGYAGELGHTYVGGMGTCHCGSTGCLETEVSQIQLTEVLGFAADAADGDPLPVWQPAPGAAMATIERQARYLAIALGNSINMLNPGLIVLGGFLRGLPDGAGQVLRREVAKRSMRSPQELVRIVPASLGSRTLMIGAAERAFAPLLADPAP